MQKYDFFDVGALGGAKSRNFSAIVRCLQIRSEEPAPQPDAYYESRESLSQNFAFLIFNFFGSKTGSFPSFFCFS